MSSTPSDDAIVEPKDYPESEPTDNTLQETFDEDGE
jgi:hypothetical protein